MASPIKALITLDEPLIRYVTWLTRLKKLKDEKACGEENEVGYLFLAKAGYEAVKDIDNGLP